MAPQRNNPEDKAYRQAVDDLLGLVNYEVKPPPMRFDTQGWHLEAFARLLERLGSPQSAYPIVHVAGTKGKGSVTRMTAALLKAGGLGKVGIFTSPHIHSFRERIAINGRPISKGDFAGIFDKVRATQSGDNSEGFRTTFETLTAMALVYFKEQQCDAVVLETGLGGRLDATNVPCSEIAVITSIGYDHQKVLGDTLREIAGEKAGIVKAGVKAVVIGPQARGRGAIVERAVRKRAEQWNIPVSRLKESQSSLRSVQADSEGFLLDLDFEGRRWEEMRFPFLGRHQIRNFQTALEAVRLFSGHVRELHWHEGRLQNTFLKLRLPGKIETVLDKPPVIVDAAHCPASSAATAQALREHFGKVPVVLLLGILGDKNLRQIIGNLIDGLDCVKVIGYRPPTPRAVEVGKVMAVLQAHGVRGAESFDSAREAVKAGLREMKQGRVMLATGSTYGIGPVVEALQNQGFSLKASSID